MKNDQRNKQKKATIYIALLFGLIILAYGLVAPSPDKMDYGEYEALRAGQHGN